MTLATPINNISFTNLHTVVDHVGFPHFPPNIHSVNLTVENVPFLEQNLDTKDFLVKRIIKSSEPVPLSKNRRIIKVKAKANGEFPTELFSKGFQPHIIAQESSRGRTATVKPRSTSTDSPSGNSTLAHLKVLWTALSLALGVEVDGELIRGLPCITRFNQLFCRSGGTSYPSDKIERFIDDNKALIRRMHGEFINLSLLAESIRTGRKKRSIFDKLSLEEMSSANLTSPDGDLDLEGNFVLQDPSKPAGDDNPYVNVVRRSKRQSRPPGPLPKSEKDRVDACLSEEEVATPYWASNSRGKILAIVNLNKFTQIIHQEICTKKSTKRCNNDCGCEQKYKYHRLMAYDPDNDCKGIFMDWFLFPSCCSCRCDPL